MGKEGINPLVGKHCFMSGKETVRRGGGGGGKKLNE